MLFPVTKQCWRGRHANRKEVEKKPTLFYAIYLERNQISWLETLYVDLFYWKDESVFMHTVPVFIKGCVHTQSKICVFKCLLLFNSNSTNTHKVNVGWRDFYTHILWVTPLCHEPAREWRVGLVLHDCFLSTQTHSSTHLLISNQIVFESHAERR